MNREELFQNIRAKGSFLCVGLDTDIDRIPSHLLNTEDPIFEFNKAIIDATADLCVAYKPNIAFYECLGPAGWETLKKTIDYIPDECFVIADCKRGDIGNTSRYYAKTFFEAYNCDAVTVAPYMGHDSVLPFLDYQDKWVIILALTSNEGALDFQFLTLDSTKKPLYQKVIQRSTEWGDADNLMFVVGATRAEMFKQIRELCPDHFLLVPGVGAQGGDLKTVAGYGLNDRCGLLVNSSRSILYADETTRFMDGARQAAKEIRDVMQTSLYEKGLL